MERSSRDAANDGYSCSGYLCAPGEKFSAGLLSGLNRFWYPRRSAQQTDFIFIHIGDNCRSRIFGAGAIEAGSGGAEPACATNFRSGSAANCSAAGRASRSSNSSSEENFGHCRTRSRAWRHGFRRAGIDRHRRERSCPELCPVVAHFSGGTGAARDTYAANE